LNCPDRGVAIRQIEQQNCIPIRIDPVMTTAPATAVPTAPAISCRKFLIGSQLNVLSSGPDTENSAQSVARFYRAARAFATSGMTLDEGLGVLEKRLKHPRVQQMIRTLHQALVDGRSFSQALREFPRIFLPLYVNLVAAGEASGALPEILMRLVKHLTQAKSLRDRVQQALIYPAFLTLAGAALITVFITFMVPQLTQFMSQNGGALPLPTRLLMQAHHLIITYWWLANLTVIGGFAAWRAFVRSDEGRTAWDRFRLRIPGYGRIVRHSYYAQFSRTLGTLTENGIPLLRSLDLVAEIAGNRYIEKKLTDVRRAVVDGAHLSAALAAQQMFPDLLTDMMAVGEQTGHFGQTMMTIADVYERELDRTVTITSGLIAPVIIVIIAIVVGFVVYSILSAVFSMTQSLQFRAR
jgi:type II secretory pathway component PulF